MISPLEGAMRAPIMLRMVDLPHPDGPTRATNSLSRMSKETRETAETSRAPWANVFERSRMLMRTRPPTSALELGLRLLDEAHVDGLGVGNRLVDGEGDPHLHAAVVVLLLDGEIPVEDRPVVPHRPEA